MTVFPPTSMQPTTLSVAEGYARWASIYDAPGNALIGLETRALAPLLAGIEPRRVFDAATGTGRWALHFAQRGAAVIAVDQSQEMLVLAQRKAAAQGVKSIRFVRASIGAPLPVPPGQADLAICALALCHVDDLAVAIANLCRAVRPAGHVVVTDLHPDAVAAGLGTTFWREGRQYAIRTVQHTCDDYLKAIAANGFELVARRENALGEAFADLPLGLPPSLASGDWRSLALSLVLVARRPALVPSRD